MRILLASAGLVAGLALGTGVAPASTVSLEGTTAVLRAGPAASDITSNGAADGTNSFADALQVLEAGPGCVAGPPVSCPGAVDHVLLLGRGDDRVKAFNFGPLTVSGDDGADDIDANGSRTTVTGGGGNDALRVASNGVTTASGGTGDDEIRSSFGGDAFLDGGAGDDLIVGGTRANHITGGEGNDRLIAEVGFGDIDGGPGSDVIVVRPQGVTAGGYTVDGGNGGDIIAGGSQPDMLGGGNGNDLIDASGDGPGDTVNCGAGLDLVRADPGDDVARNCEFRVNRFPAAAAVAGAVAAAGS
jgi:Ca2+-binding RTX toxin-like protein